MFTLEDTSGHAATISFTLSDVVDLPGIYEIASAMRPGTTRIFHDEFGRRLRLRRF